MKRKDSPSGTARSSNPANVSYLSNIHTLEDVDQKLRVLADTPPTNRTPEWRRQVNELLDRRLELSGLGGLVEKR